MLWRPDPHPLDYDWRFTEATVQNLTRFAVGSRVLAVGTPLLVDRLRASGRDVELVERQPLPGVAGRQIDLNYAPPFPEIFDCAFCDPPWYPAEYTRWVSWTAQHVRPHGRILVSMWPQDTRPSAPDEREAILASFSAWARPEVFPGVVEYEVPVFEAVALGARSPWRRGDLLQLTVCERPELQPALPATELWHRFIWDHYQLAIRLDPDAAECTLQAHPRAAGWRWPSVSRRAPGRGDIGLWSSHQEVAVVTGVCRLLKGLVRFTATHGTDMRELADELRELFTAWQLPSRPFTRVHQWIHLA